MSHVQGGTYTCAMYGDPNAKNRTGFISSLDARHRPRVTFAQKASFYMKTQKDILRSFLVIFINVRVFWASLSQSSWSLSTSVTPYLMTTLGWVSAMSLYLTCLTLSWPGWYRGRSKGQRAAGRGAGRYAGQARGRRGRGGQEGQVPGRGGAGSDPWLNVRISPDFSMFRAGS